MPRGFTEIEKENIRRMLLESCQASWKKYGYRHTSVDTLCLGAGISKGAFYKFFKSKEELFAETVKSIQDNIYDLVDGILKEEPNKYGYARALKVMYREQAKDPYLYDTSSTDFLCFMNKLSEQERSELSNNGLLRAEKVFQNPGLKVKIEKDKAMAVSISLLNMVTYGDTLPYDSYQTFEYMVDKLIIEMFE